MPIGPSDVLDLRGPSAFGASQEAPMFDCRHPPQSSGLPRVFLRSVGLSSVWDCWHNVPASVLLAPDLGFRAFSLRVFRLRDLR